MYVCHHYNTVTASHATVCCLINQVSDQAYFQGYLCDRGEAGIFSLVRLTFDEREWK